MDQNKVQTMQVYGHTIKYINETSDTEDIDQIKNSIDDGDREGTLFWEGMIVPIGRWWIVDWKEIAKELHDQLAVADNMIRYDDDSPRHVRIRREISEALRKFENANK